MSLLLNIFLIISFLSSIVLNCFFIFTYFKQCDEILCLNSEIVLLQKSIVELQSVSSVAVDLLPYSIFKDPYVIGGAFVVGGVLIVVLWLYFGFPSTPPPPPVGSVEFLNSCFKDAAVQTEDAVNILTPFLIYDLATLDRLGSACEKSTIDRQMLFYLASCKFLANCDTDGVMLKIIENGDYQNCVIGYNLLQNISRSLCKLVEQIGPMYLQ